METHYNMYSRDFQYKWIYFKSFVSVSISNLKIFIKNLTIKDVISFIYSFISISISCIILFFRTLFLDPNYHINQE